MVNIESTKTEDFIRSLEKKRIIRDLKSSLYIAGLQDDEKRMKQLINLLNKLQ